jgi:hypothetical protein
MKDFLDLNGASGATYRFRIWAEGAPHQQIAGNYVFLREEPEGFKVLLVGVTNDLSNAGTDWSKVAKRGATHLFTRLNISRAARQAEHDDLVAHHKTALVSESVS